MQARPLLNTASLWLQTSFRKQARPLLSTASLSLAALWRFGAVPLLEALTLIDALALLEALPLWRFVVLRRLGALRLFDASWRSGNTAAMNTGDSACVSELAALRLCGLRVPWRLCGFAACAFHGGFAALRNAALRLARSMAALRLCGLRVPWWLCGFAACAFHGGFAALRLARSMAALRLARSMAALRLCGFAASTLFRVRACTRTLVQCIYIIVCIYIYIQMYCTLDIHIYGATKPQGYSDMAWCSFWTLYFSEAQIRPVRLAKMDTIFWMLRVHGRSEERMNPTWAAGPVTAVWG